ncbi:hypothetical protein AJ79_04116 [Helicocarpus griseus UAMH5409]|uniref:Uncharacterized protein n=1 Tax=Helicocarpus griseus UAMH5409 TaxID=1447875 RepID=A0A2B7XUH4_9EURO|nr:hypothetical protein AJ79_04116 [Helicocarpus griseus UAMH5409]
MATLKRLFNVERTLFQSTSPELTENESCGPSSGDVSSCRALSSGSPERNLPRLPHMQNQTFYGIEKQFEDLHDQFRCRSSPSLKNKRFTSLEPKSSHYRKQRHVDIVEAGFPVHHPRVPTPISPEVIYNEEIANRNIHGRQRSDNLNKKYANVISAVYQEDVADRNILLSGGGPGRADSQNNFNNGRSVSSLSFYREGRPRLWSGARATGARTPSEERRAELRVISSDQDLRSHPPSYKPENVDSSPPRRIGVRQYIALRLRNSSPALSTTGPERSPPRQAPRTPVRTKTVHDASPSARDAGKAPRPVTQRSSVNPPRQDVIRPKTNPEHRDTLKPPASGDVSSRLLTPTSARLSTRKNVRDLSINTQLAAPKQNFVKVSNQPANAPIPTPKREPNASIAEIVNSPLPAATPSTVAERRPSYNVEEIMSMFRQAYKSSQAANPHPTFETLQDAIVREINSHEAFRQVASEIETMPEPDPAPISNKPTEENRGHMRKKSSSKSLSGKEKQALKFVRRNSEAKKRRNSYTPGKEMSFPAIKGLEAGTERENGSQERRRRHTYSQPLQTGAPVTPDLPLELREEARRAKSGASKISLQPKYTYKLIPDVRPKSSQSMHSRGTPSRPGTASSSEPPQARGPAQRSQDMKPETRQKQKRRNTSAAHTQPPDFQFDHVKDERDSPPVPAAGSQTPSEPKSSNSNSPQQQTTKTTPMRRLYSTSAQQIGRNRIPLRRSSLQKDLFDSGRFRL